MHPLQQKVTHLHYHYYCSHSHPQTVHQQRRNTHSQIIYSQTRPREQEEQNSIAGQDVGCMKSNRERVRSFKKLKVSNCWSTENSTKEAGQQEQETEAPDISSFTVQEENDSLQNDDCFASSQHSEARGVLKKAGQEEIMYNGIIRRYQQELQRLKHQMERLRSVEQQCIYLRKVCLQHYQHCPRPPSPQQQ